MGSHKGPYKEEFSEGSYVLIHPKAQLEQFAEKWSKHHPIQSDQFEYGGQAAQVVEVLFYHGCDELYVLRGIPGVWHEACLEQHPEPSPKLPKGAMQTQARAPGGRPHARLSRDYSAG